MPTTEERLAHLEERYKEEVAEPLRVMKETDGFNSHGRAAYNLYLNLTRAYENTKRKVIEGTFPEDPESLTKEEALALVQSLFQEEPLTWRVKSSPELVVKSIIIPEKETPEGVLVRSTTRVWESIIKELKRDWTKAYEIPSRAWEEIIAGAFKEDCFDDVILTPRSGDHGRDVIAYRRGVGTIKIIGSVKAYRPGRLVRYDDVRSLLGVMSGERDTSKGIITTTSDFPPNIMKDPSIAPFVPYRLELMNGKALQEWLKKLAARSNQ
jgi:restriction system protein